VSEPATKQAPAILSPAWWILFVLLWTTQIGCQDSSRREDNLPLEASAQPEEQGSEPVVPPALAGEQLADELVPYLCAIYQRWPMITETQAEVTAALSLVQSAAPGAIEVAASGLGTRASATCPDVIPSGSTDSSGQLPRPGGALEGIPGLFAANEPGDEATRERARHEWTAFGLGCAAVSREWEAEALHSWEQDYLERMGYTLESYIETALQVDDPAMSDRIFRRIAQCAQWAGREASD
jgi:hypothetical protein